MALRFRQKWNSLWHSSLHISRNVNISLLTYKILFRYHLTPTKLHKISHSISDRCWKVCGLPGSFLHCFWSCPRLSMFWDHIIAHINTVVEIQLPRDPAITILNIWQGFTLNPLWKELVELLLCAARSLVAQHWKTVKIPTLSKWFLKIWDFFYRIKGLFLSSELITIQYPITYKKNGFHFWQLFLVKKYMSLYFCTISTMIYYLISDGVV